MPSFASGTAVSPSINTHGSGVLSYAHPSHTRLHLSTIAHSLGNLCRFTGHCRRFYSVAEHSVLVYRYIAEMLPVTLSRKVLRTALLHDAAECAVGDVNSPLKSMIAPLYRPIENRVLTEILRQHAAFPLVPGIVKHVDTVLYLCERETMMDPLPIDHPELGYLPMTDEANAALPWLRENLNHLNPEQARDEFLWHCGRLGMAVE